MLEGYQAFRMTASYGGRAHGGPPTKIDAILRGAAAYAESELYAPLVLPKRLTNSGSSGERGLQTFRYECHVPAEEIVKGQTGSKHGIHKASVFNVSNCVDNTCVVDKISHRTSTNLQHESTNVGGWVNFSTKIFPNRPAALNYVNSNLPKRMKKKKYTLRPLPVIDYIDRTQKSSHTSSSSSSSSSSANPSQGKQMKVIFHLKRPAVEKNRKQTVVALVMEELIVSSDDDDDEGLWLGDDDDGIVGDDDDVSDSDIVMDGSYAGGSSLSIFDDQENADLAAVLEENVEISAMLRRTQEGSPIRASLKEISTNLFLQKIPRLEMKGMDMDLEFIGSEM